MELMILIDVAVLQQQPVCAPATPMYSEREAGGRTAVFFLLKQSSDFLKGAWVTQSLFAKCKEFGVGSRARNPPVWATNPWGHFWSLCLRTAGSVACCCSSTTQPDLIQSEWQADSDWWAVPHCSLIELQLSQSIALFIPRLIRLL